MTIITSVACILMLNIGNNVWETVVTTGKPIDTTGNYWTIDFTDSIKEGGYKIIDNTPTVRRINSNDCRILETRETK